MNQWPTIPLGEVLAKSEEWIQLHPDQPYKEITVRLWGNGVRRRRDVLGVEIAASTRLRVHANQFIISRIDARNGASGLIPDDLDGAIVSNDFPVFTPNPERLEPRFLGWMSKTRTFVELCKAASEGTTNRVRLKEDRFLAMQIHLPPLAEQRRLVERIDALAAKIAEAKRLREKADQEGERLLIGMAHRHDLSAAEKAAQGWEEMTLGQVVKLKMEGVSVRSDETYPNLGIYSFGKGLFKKPPIDGMTTSAKTLFRVHAEQFIYSRLFAFEGAYGVVTEEYDNHFISNEYPTFELNQSLIHPGFLRAYFMSPRIWGEVAAGSKGLGDRRQRVHPDQILSHRLSIPPIEWQARIAQIQAQLDSEFANCKQISVELDAMLPAILDRAFNGELGL